MTLVYLLLGLLLAGFLWLCYGTWRIGRLSTGAPIGPRPGTALLLVDLQTVFWEGGAYAEADKTRAIDAIGQEIAEARARNLPIIAIRQEWSQPETKTLARLFMKGQALPGSPGTEIAAPFAGAAQHTLVKRVQDGFETGALDPLLSELDVGALRIVGLDFNYCVLKTALAARQRGYDVTVVTAGTLAAGARATSEARLTGTGVRLA
ncbi:cysteine hydrolase family protein [Dinoroseobacter sp. S375]|uniref:cysteine hydrolase family protein n=1 Tax=Dinoroseobacter sp. S375 TaxID=3415136 RepID=UPI003C797170